jgi:hypothetical protein
MDKRTMLSANDASWKKRSSRLVNADQGRQVQSSELELDDGTLLIHLKFWNRELGWIQEARDESYGLVAQVGPTRTEPECWKALVNVLDRKGYAV